MAQENLAPGEEILGNTKRISASVRWCFTLNNYTEDEVKHVQELVPDMATFVLYGKETGEEGTPHLQGYIQFNKDLRLSAIKKKLPRAHLEVARGSPEQNIEYCSKDGDVFTKGKLRQRNSGKRNDLELFKEAVKDGNFSIDNLREEHSDVFAKYPRFCREYIQASIPEPELPSYALFPWQAALSETLKGDPDDRKIIFVVDTAGNSGKTWFAKYFCSLFPDKTQYMESSKKADMAYALNPGIKTLFINVTRTQNEFFNYSFIESVKDGMVFSSKYESGLKRLGNCHVVVMMNQRPDETALSRDRYSIQVIKNNNLREHKLI